MILNMMDKIVYELFYAPVYIPFYTLAIIAFWYVVFLALFDIMQLLSDITEDYIKPWLKKTVRRLIIAIHLRYLDLSDRVRFYQEKKELKGGSYKELENKNDE